MRGWIFRCVGCLAFARTMSHGAELNIVRCEPGEWQGGRVGFDLGGEPVIDSNGVKYAAYVIAWAPGAKTAQVTYGTETYQGDIIYDYGDRTVGYVIIVTRPKQIIEQLVVNAATGKVIITNTKRLYGLWQDSFL